MHFGIEFECELDCEALHTCLEQILDSCSGVDSSG